MNFAILKYMAFFVEIWRDACLRHTLSAINYSDVMMRATTSQITDCLLNCLFRYRSKKILKLRITGLCEGNPPATGGFPSQRASDAENVTICWRQPRWYKCIILGDIDAINSEDASLASYNYSLWPFNERKVPSSCPAKHGTKKLWENTPFQCV